MAKEEVLVWEDKTGKYKLGYSQYLQQKILKINTMLLIAVIILIIMIGIGFLYAHALIQRVDQLDLVSKMIASMHQ